MTPQNTPLKVAVVTGGHAYDVPNFQRLFRELPGIDAYVQHMDDFACSPEDVRDGYDVVVFYIMLTSGPTDEGLPWYAGKPLAALSHLGATGQGIVLLHHAILAYPQWPVWTEISGLAERGIFGFDHDQTLDICVADPQHPIVAGVSDWRMVDETYSMPDVTADSHVLLTTDHPKSMKVLGWTRTYRNSRVFCFQSGHDNQTWPDANFRRVLTQGVVWAAGR
jgi:uncharacterized protein